MPFEQPVEPPLQRFDGQRTLESECLLQVVRSPVRLHPVEEPHPFLRRGQPQWSFSVDPHDIEGSGVVPSALHDGLRRGRESRNRRRGEQRSDRNVDPMAIAYARRDHRGQQGVAAEREELVIQPDRRVVEDLSPDRENSTLKIGPGALRQHVLGVPFPLCSAAQRLSDPETLPAGVSPLTILGSEQSWTGDL